MKTNAALHIGSEEWIDIVVKGASQLGLTVNRFQASQFARHGQLLMQWNRKVNLTAITDPTQVAVKHFLDAIAPLNYIPAKGRMLDMGTGGGFPGIPLKILRPGQAMTLVDSVRKKINFVKFVIGQLNLTEIDALHSRIQDLWHLPEHAQKYHVVVCRALTDLTEAVQMAVPFLADEGALVAFHGPRDAHQFSGGRLVTGIKGRQIRLNVITETYRLPFLHDHRSVSIITFDEPTSALL